MPPQRRRCLAHRRGDQRARSCTWRTSRAANSRSRPRPKQAAKPERDTTRPPRPSPTKPAAPATPAAEAKPAAVDGKAVYDKVCVACHAQSIAGSPRLGDKAAWAPRIQQGMDALVQSVIKGKGAMPPRAGNPSLTDAEARAAVEFMVSQSK